MKKRGACILAAALILWSSIDSFAHADNIFSDEVESISKQNNSTGGSISITYDAPAPSNRYRVEIDWGEMEFCFHPADRVWDTIELKWKEPAANAKGSWTTKSGKEFSDGIPKIPVTLKNYSSSAVEAHFLTDDKDFTRTPVTLDNGITLELANGNPVVGKAVANSDPEKKGEPTTEKFLIALGGEPAVPLDNSEFQTIIPVTCIIEPAN